MSKAAAGARAEAEKRAKEAAFARKRAREALEHVAFLVAREKVKWKELAAAVSAEVSVAKERNHKAEYGMGNEVSTLGDVYSYGILLLEMFTGKRPMESMFSDGLNLHTFAKAALPDQVANIIDPLLFQQRDMGEASSSLNSTNTQNSPSIHKTHECLVSILKVGIACSQELPTDRMDIKVVVSHLLGIRNSLLQVDDH